MEYSYSYSTNFDALSPTFAIASLALYVLYVIGMWKVYTKAGEPGWKSIIPIYNVYIMYKISWGNGLLFLLTLIPIVNVIVNIIMIVKLAQAFGKGTGFALGLIFFQFIFLMILGFGSSQYIGPNGMPPYGGQPPYGQNPYGQNPYGQNQYNQYNQNNQNGPY